MKEKINLSRARELHQILSGKKQPQDRYARKLASIKHKMNFDAGLERKSYLFFFERKFYHVKDVLKKIFEADVETTIYDNPGTEIFFMCATNICPMPDALSGKKKTSKKVKDDQEAAEFMTKTTGITISKNDL
jgi:hypothetical protein